MEPDIIDDSPFPTIAEAKQMAFSKRAQNHGIGKTSIYEKEHEWSDSNPSSLSQHSDKNVIIDTETCSVDSRMVEINEPAPELQSVPSYWNGSETPGKLYSCIVFVFLVSRVDL